MVWRFVKVCQVSSDIVSQIVILAPQNPPIHDHHQFHVRSTQVRNIDSYIVNARVSACKWYMPKIAYRVKYDTCGSDTVAALTYGDELCKAVGVNTDDYCTAAKSLVRL